MKYLFYIFASFIIFSLIISWFIFSDNREDSSKEIALIINDKKICVNEYLHPASGRINHNAEDKDYQESLIIRELLIQEARQQEIDKEENFRLSLQRFYEQSLIKTLMDRQYDQLDVTISDQEIITYNKWLASTVVFTMSTYTTHKDIKTNKPKAQETKKSNYEELSEFTQQQLFELKPGQQSAPIHFLDEYLVFQLKSVKFPSSLPEINSQKDLLRNKLATLKKEQIMSTWLNQLREKANISILLGGKNTKIP
ncbi:MAG: hypothetical protein OEL87_02335 [Nanoarchaeota archaeon]|nr:hypothetical protein [Nanoarchaeota archaeon]